MTLNTLSSTSNGWQYMTAKPRNWPGAAPLSSSGSIWADITIARLPCPLPLAGKVRGAGRHRHTACPIPLSSRLHRRGEGQAALDGLRHDGVYHGSHEHRL